MTGSRQLLGRKGEDVAAAYLERDGQRVLQRNYRCPLGEIDLVVQDGRDLVFVEVRTKRQPCLFRPEETIDRRKAHRMVRLGEHFLAASGDTDQPWRVDVVVVEFDPRGNPVRIEQFRDATSGIVTP